MDLELRTYLLLLVEDSSSDAELVAEMLADPAAKQYNILRATSIANALEQLKTTHVDVILLDLILPDSTGSGSVKAIRAAANNTPIVVLTGTNDEQLALVCIDAGAQDYLTKEEMRPHTLRRAIGYAITRQREAQIRELQETLDRLRQLSSVNTNTQTTAKLMQNGSLRERHSNEFGRIVGDYSSLLGVYLDHLVVYKEKPRDQMEVLITRLGDLGGGPRDLMDVHLDALDANVAKQNPDRGRALAVEGRLLALEMMGLLVDYYRIGQRRRFL
jgi:CheY-like chemotaxis protein